MPLLASSPTSPSSHNWLWVHDLVDALHAWLDPQVSRLPGRSRLAEAVRYALGRWAALSRFLDDGRIDLDTNSVGRAIRPVSLGRKNSLFAGSDGGAARWAIVASLIETCKLNGIGPDAWLAAILTLMVEGILLSNSMIYCLGRASLPPAEPLRTRTLLLRYSSSCRTPTKLECFTRAITLAQSMTGPSAYTQALLTGRSLAKASGPAGNQDMCC